MYTKLSGHRCLSSESGNKHTNTYNMRFPQKSTVPLPRLERLLTRNLDPMMDKGFPFLGTCNLDKLPQNFEVAKMYNARHHTRNDFQASTLHLNRYTCGDVHFKDMDLFLMCRDSYMYFSAFWLLCPATGTHFFLDVHTVLLFVFLHFLQNVPIKMQKTPDKTQHTTNPKL